MYAICKLSLQLYIICKLLGWMRKIPFHIAIRGSIVVVEVHAALIEWTKDERVTEEQQPGLLCVCISDYHVPEHTSKEEPSRAGTLVGTYTASCATNRHSYCGNSPSLCTAPEVAANSPLLVHLVPYSSCTPFRPSVSLGLMMKMHSNRSNYIEILCAYPILDFLCSYQSVNHPRPLCACNS